MYASVPYPSPAGPLSPLIEKSTVSLSTIFSSPLIFLYNSTVIYSIVLTRLDVFDKLDKSYVIIVLLIP